MLEQAASLTGAALVLAAYAALQAGRMSRENASYHVVNAAGGALLLIVAVTTRQAGFIVLEGAWTAISLVALARMAGARARARA